MKQVTDDKGYKYSVKEEIGSDGQGKLYSTNNANVIIREAEGVDPKEYDNVKVLPISNIKKLILPDNYIGNSGYVLKIPESFVPLSNLMKHGAKDDFYISTGGLKRRLDILAGIAQVLNELHAIPVMYGSMAPCRIFIDSDVSHNDAYLLYSKKMDFSMSFREETDEDPYISPEAKKGMGSTLACDSYTFAALASDLLTNYNTQIISPALNELLNKAGREPGQRPAMLELHKTLLKELDLLIKCKKCMQDFYFETAKCPICKAELPRLIKASIYDESEGKILDRGTKVWEFAVGIQSLYNYHTDNVLTGDTIESRIDCAINVSRDRKVSFIIKNLMEKEIFVNKKPLPTRQATLIQLPCESIDISYPLFSSVKRCINLVMI